MFIKITSSGYNRYGEQFARGQFLVLFAHNRFKAEEQANRLVCGPSLWPWIKADLTVVCTCAGNPLYYQKSCPVHSGEYVIPAVDGRKLYAVVRYCSLRQMGHWMMGTIRIAGQPITISGSYGGDGLPRDYEDLSLKARSKVIEVPKDIEDAFWAGGGHNCAGSEATVIRQWAKKAFAV